MQMQIHFTHSGHHYPHINNGQQFGMQIGRLAWLYLRSELIHSDPFRSKTKGHAFRRPMSQLQIGFFLAFAKALFWALRVAFVAFYLTTGCRQKTNKTKPQAKC